MFRARKRNVTTIMPERRARPLPVSLDVNRSIQISGYGFHTAYVFAPHWTMPQRESRASKLSSRQFKNDTTSRYIHVLTAHVGASVL